jgi:hypothetical protein
VPYIRLTRLLKWLISPDVFYNEYEQVVYSQRQTELKDIEARIAALKRFQEQPAL